MGLFKKKRRPGDPPPMGSLEYRIALTQRYLNIWQRFFQHFAESLKDKKITAEMEKDFSRLLYQLAYEHFKFSKMQSPGFKGSEKIMSILNDCVSLSHLKKMPDASFSALQVAWHEVFIEINKSLGHMLAQLPVEASPKESTAKVKKVAANVMKS